MAKQKNIYVCNACAAQAPKWTGQCMDCGAWNTLQEESVLPNVKKSSRFEGFSTKAQLQSLQDVSTTQTSRISSGLGELDRVLGGGLVAGSVILLGGDPGIGKSTLILQSLHLLAQSQTVLYVTGEESVQQIGMRANRLKLQNPAIDLLAENHLESILQIANKLQPKIVVIDSIQTVFTDSLQSAPGSVAQVRETASHLVRYGKQSNTVIILVGHVTKEGHIAGPRVLEHMVDTVLHFEGDNAGHYRMIRAIKNRFGAVNEIGIFAMTDVGLKGVNNPSAMLISKSQANATGNVILVSQEGTRPLLVEVQALVDQSGAPNPRRVTIGLDNARLVMLLAVLSRHLGTALYDKDVFVNVIGGIKVHEPAADLAIILAILSSYRDYPLPEGLAVFGEIGLTGEIRPVQNGLSRIKEAEKLGFTQLILPQANTKGAKTKNIKCHTVQHVNAAVELVFS